MTSHDAERQRLVGNCLRSPGGSGASNTTSQFRGEQTVVRDYGVFYIDELRPRP